VIDRRGVSDPRRFAEKAGDRDESAADGHAPLTSAI
jgi:hypothetical protein